MEFKLHHIDKMLDLDFRLNEIIAQVYFYCSIFTWLNISIKIIFIRKSSCGKTQ